MRYKTKIINIGYRLSGMGQEIRTSKLLPLLSLERLRLNVKLKDTSKCAVREEYGFSSSYVSNCKWCSKIAWKFMFYFMICSYSKLEGTKKEFVKHWSEKHYHHIPADEKAV
jgi:hypothetical protein